MLCYNVYYLLYDNDVDILMASVGGIVIKGMLPYIDYESSAKNPKPIIGMSDVTALLMSLYDCETGLAYFDLIYDCIGRPSIPVLAEFDFSHCAPMLTIPIGITAELDADMQTIKLIR